jgi:murein DD-endopeptidase MepM/ murein hydrolase activator NlpD
MTNPRFLKINLLILSLLLISIFSYFTIFESFRVKSQSIAETQLTTKFKAKQKEIESRKAVVENSFIQAGEHVAGLEVQINSLQDEITKRQDEIKEVSNLIIEVKNIIIDIEKQQKELEIKINKSADELSQILAKTLDESRVPLIEKLLSGSIADALKRMTYLTELNEQAKNLIISIENNQKELEQNKAFRIKTQEELEQTQSLLESKKASLQVLLDQTQGEQAKYEELMRQFQSQAEQARLELQKENDQYIKDVQSVRAEEARRAELLRKEEEERKRNNNGNGNNTNNNGGGITGTGSGGFRGCWWEVPAPSGIPKGYFSYPTSGRLTNPLVCGSRSSYNHDGIDIASGIGTSLNAIGNGKVVKKGAPVSCIGFSCNGGFGNYVIVEHVIPSGRKVYALYAHMQFASDLEIGTNVTKGQRVGRMGCTGNTQPYPCGVHLHFMLIDETLDYGISCIYSGARCINPLSVF